MTAAARAALRGLVAFAVLAGVGIAIGLAEYAASGGRYRLWTWIKVGFLYDYPQADDLFASSVRLGLDEVAADESAADTGTAFGQDDSEAAVAQEDGVAVFAEVYGFCRAFDPAGRERRRDDVVQ